MTSSAKIFLGVMTGLVVFAGVIGLGSLALYHVISIRQANELAIEGYRAAAAGDYDVAIARYTAALRKPIRNQQRASVYTNRGYVYNARGQFAEAIADHTEAIRLNPRLSYAFAARGYSYLSQSEWEKALADLTESIRLDPNSDSAYYNRGLVFVRTGQLSDALIDFNEAVRCSPERADRLVARALCYLAMDDFDRALANFDGAVATEPGNAIGYVGRSNLYARRGDAEKQRRDYERALGLNPNAETLWTDFSQWFDKEQSSARTGRDATSHLNQTSFADSNVQPDNFVTRNAGKSYHELFREAQIAHNEGKYDDEILLWNDVAAMNLSALQVSPVIMNRGSAYAAKGDPYRAIQDYNEAIKLDPGNAGAYVNRALAQSRLGDSEATMNDYAKAIALNPKQWQAYFNRAAEYKDRGELREALADLKQAIGLNPDFAGAYVNRASIYVRQNELDKAVADYSAALQRDPGLSDVHVWRAKVLLRQKKYPQAVSDLQAAARMKTKRPETALNSLAWLRATCPDPAMRNGKEAVELAVKACDLSQWENWGTIDTLAAAYAEKGDFNQATTYENRALQMVKSSTDQNKLQRRLALYETHQPYRETANDD